MKSCFVLCAAVSLAAISLRADDRDLFQDVVAPILKDKCIGCHGTEKVKAKLRLDSFAGIMKGGEDGKIIVPGKAKDSMMYKNLLLAKSEDDHMPPPKKPQPSAAEIAVIGWWIDKGAPEHLKLADAGAVPDAATPALEAAKK